MSEPATTVFPTTVDVVAAAARRRRHRGSRHRRLTYCQPFFLSFLLSIRTRSLRPVPISYSYTPSLNICGLWREYSSAARWRWWTTCRVIGVMCVYLCLLSPGLSGYK